MIKKKDNLPLNDRNAQQYNSLIYNPIKEKNKSIKQLLKYNENVTKQAEKQVFNYILKNKELNSNNFKKKKFSVSKGKSSQSIRDIISNSNCNSDMKKRYMSNMNIASSNNLNNNKYENNGKNEK